MIQKNNPEQLAPLDAIDEFVDQTLAEVGIAEGAVSTEILEAFGLPKNLYDLVNETEDSIESHVSEIPSDKVIESFVYLPDLLHVDLDWPEERISDPRQFLDYEQGAGATPFLRKLITRAGVYRLNETVPELAAEDPLSDLEMGACLLFERVLENPESFAVQELTIGAAELFKQRTSPNSPGEIGLDPVEVSLDWESDGVFSEEESHWAFSDAIKEGLVVRNRHSFKGYRPKPQYMFDRFVDKAAWPVEKIIFGEDNRGYRTTEAEIDEEKVKKIIQRRLEKRLTLEDSEFGKVKSKIYWINGGTGISIPDGRVQIIKPNSKAEDLAAAVVDQIDIESLLNIGPTARSVRDDYGQRPDTQAYSYVKHVDNINDFEHRAIVHPTPLKTLSLAELDLDLPVHFDSGKKTVLELLKGENDEEDELGLGDLELSPEVRELLKSALNFRLKINNFGVTKGVGKIFGLIYIPEAQASNELMEAQVIAHEVSAHHAFLTEQEAVIAELEKEVRNNIPN